MSIQILSGNIFNSDATCLVNTVNTVGVMGKGVALVYRLRYPDLFEAYKKACASGELSIGRGWLYSPKNSPITVYNFPTKRDWKHPSSLRYIEDGLAYFLDSYKDLGLQSVAFPLLGTENGGLEKNVVLPLMEKVLGRCDIPIEIYEYNSSTPEKLFLLFRSKWRRETVNSIQQATGLSLNKISAISEYIDYAKQPNMIGLLNIKGVGMMSMTKCFHFVMKEDRQLSLDF
jgi:O-acetyl-ADP-ribose deacetylase (regulator of RNase III)